MKWIAINEAHDINMSMTPRLGDKMTMRFKMRYFSVFKEQPKEFEIIETLPNMVLKDD